MAKSIPYKDRPVIRIEGLLIQRETIRFQGEKKYEYTVQKGKTNYKIIGPENALDGMGINDRGVFDCIESQAISFKFAKVKLSDKELRENLGVESITYNAPAKDPSVFKRVTIKKEYLKLVTITKAGFNFENQ
jgi:hypothetical protein